MPSSNHDSMDDGFDPVVLAELKPSLTRSESERVIKKKKKRKMRITKSSSTLVSSMTSPATDDRVPSTVTFAKDPYNSERSLYSNEGESFSGSHFRGYKSSYSKGKISPMYGEHDDNSDQERFHGNGELLSDSEYDTDLDINSDSKSIGKFVGPVLDDIFV